MTTGLILLVLIGVVVAYRLDAPARQDEAERHGQELGGPDRHRGRCRADAVGHAQRPLRPRRATTEAGQGRRPLRGISNQTALPSGVGRDPHRVASCSTRYRPRPPSSVSAAVRIRGSRRSGSKTSTHTDVRAPPQAQRELPGPDPARVRHASSQPGTPAPWTGAGPVRAGAAAALTAAAARPAGRAGTGSGARARRPGRGHDHRVEVEVEVAARARRDRGVQHGVGDHLRDQQAGQVDLLGVHAPRPEGLGGQPPGLGHHDRLGGERPARWRRARTART